MINRSEGKKYTAWGRLWTKAVLCCFHKHITQFWENKSVTLNKHAFLQKWIWKYGFLIMITHNGYYPILPPEPDSVEPFDISLTVLMRGIPLGFSHRWALLTYLQTARTTVDDQFVSFCCVEDKNGAVDLSVVNRYWISSAPFVVFFSVASCLHLIVYSEIRFYPLSFLDCLFFLMIFSLQVKLSRLCEQDKILQELEATIRTLKEDKVFLLYIHKISFFSDFHMYNICVSLHWCGP